MVVLRRIQFKAVEYIVTSLQTIGNWENLPAADRYSRESAAVRR
jgi:hypothetical protein